MCGIAALQIRDPRLRGQLGELVHGMLCEIVDRGPDSVGIALYDDLRLTPDGTSTVTVLESPGDPAELAAALGHLEQVAVTDLGETLLVNARATTDELEAAVRRAAPGARLAGRGERVAVLKGAGHPLALAESYGLTASTGTQALSHTRMATESAVTASGAHPFTVADDLCLVHNGSFSNHATVRRDLRAVGVEFDSENDSEVAARYVAWRLREGDDLETALVRLGTVLDGFYTLVVTTADSLAVVRDPIACKPAIVAETDAWVAIASEYRALAGLPGIEDARVFEPTPGVVYTWTQPTADVLQEA